jgi:C1A family cysteine protease
MKVTQKNLGWIKDYPDFRDFNLHTSIPSKNVAARGKQETVKGLLDRTRMNKKNILALEKKVDNREWCSKIKNQGNLGACTAFSAVAMYEYYQNKAFGKFIDGSELFVYKVTRNMLNWTGDTGAYIRSVMGAIALFGIPPASVYQYDKRKFDHEPPAFVYSYAQNFQAITYYRLDPLGSTGRQTLDNIKIQLNAGFPVIMGFTCYSSLNHPKTEETGEIPFPSKNESVIGGHAVMVVGYDDYNMVTNPIDGSKRRGVLIVRNSWGENWGDNGYGYIPYEYVKRLLASDFWCMISAEWIDTGQFSI